MKEKEPSFYTVFSTPFPSFCEQRRELSSHSNLLTKAKAVLKDIRHRRPA